MSFLTVKSSFISLLSIFKFTFLSITQSLIDPFNFFSFLANITFLKVFTLTISFKGWILYFNTRLFNFLTIDSSFLTNLWFI